MNRISADRMYLAKWVLPPVAFIGIAAYMFWKESYKARPHYVILSFALAVLALIFVFVFRKRMWNLADEVLDGGTYLIVRSRGREAIINFASIVKVQTEGGFGATTIRLVLANRCEFGEVVSFLAKSISRNPFALNAIAEDLISRVSRANGAKAA